MWLEGAVQNGWSIAQMQGERARTLGAVVEEQVEATGDEMDEDAFDVPADHLPESAAPSASDSGSDAFVEDGIAAVADADFDHESTTHNFTDATETHADAPPAVRPFENLPTLPADLREAFDNFKLAIVHHRIAKWQEVTQADVLTTLDSLRQLVLAPADE
jgi:hypothetical protein